MGHFDQEKQKAKQIASKFAEFIALVKQNSQQSTSTLRHFIAKVEKHEKSLEDIARTASARLSYLKDVEQSLQKLEELEKKAAAVKEGEAAEILKDKKWGAKLDYGSYKAAQPAKPQLIALVKERIGEEVARGRHILSEQEKAVLAWQISAQKHVKACEKAKGAIAATEL